MRKKDAWLNAMLSDQPDDDQPEREYNAVFVSLDSFDEEIQRRADFLEAQLQADGQPARIVTRKGTYSEGDVIHRGAKPYLLRLCPDIEFEQVTVTRWRIVRIPWRNN